MLFLGIKIPRYITNYVAQRQLPEFIEHLYHATVQYAAKKSEERYKNKDPGYEYPADVRLDNFQNDEEPMPDNVNKMEKIEFPLVEKESVTVEEDSNKKSWWSYFYPFNYF